MGSFNTTCFVSQQTITPGAQVYILPVMQSLSYSPVSLKVGDETVEKYSYTKSPTSCNAFWTLCGPIVSGNYDDYGRFDLDDSNSNMLALTALFNDLYKHNVISCDFDITKKFNPEVDYTMSELEEIWKYMWNAFQKNTLFARNVMNKISPLAFAVMHRSAGDYLVNAVSTKKTSYCSDMSPEVFFKEYLNQQMAKYEAVLDKDAIEGNEVFIGIQLSSLEDMPLGVSNYYIPSFYNVDYRQVIEIVKEHFIQNPKAFTFDDTTVEQLYGMFEDCLHAMYIVSGMRDLYINFSPMVYAGQDYHNEIGNERLKMMKAINKVVKADIKAHYEE